MKKRFCLILTAVVIAILATILFSLTVFGAETSAVTPVNSVYTAENAEQLIWIFENTGAGGVPLSATIKLANDIDVNGKLPMITRSFTGVLDGNGKTISGISNPLFLDFKGTAKNLTLRGKIEATAEQMAVEKAPKAATFALNAFEANFTNVVSYVDLQVNADVFHAGGLVGAALSKGTFVGCEYRGEMTVAWGQESGAVGGILGFYKPNGVAVSFENCCFGGRIAVTGGATNKKLAIGGILGQNGSAAASFKNCVSNGTITSAVTAGEDYVGGIFGISETNQNTVEFCSNKSTVTAVKNAGGIIGAIKANTKIISCTNHGDITAENVGEFCGSGKGYTFTTFTSYDFSKADNKVCSTDFVSNSSYTSEAMTFEKTFTLGEKEYEVYNHCTIEKESGCLIQTLKTITPFEAFVSTRDDGNTQAFRFVIVSNLTCKAPSITVSVRFKDYGNQVIKSYTGKLASQNSDLHLYSAVAASGENYFAAEGFALFGCVITDVPVGAWGSVELTVTDTANGTSYLEPVEIRGYKEYLKMETLPDMSSLGDVSGTYNCGPGLMSDQGGYTEEDSFMKVITNTSKERFEAYVKGLSEHGFTFVSKTTLDGDDYYTYARYGSFVYLYYNSRINEIRIIADNSSDLLASVMKQDTATGSGKAAFYQYSINYSGHNAEGYDPVDYADGDGLDCGMMYILKTADNRIIMVDGGHSGQLSANARKALLAFLRQITGTPENKKVKIAAWFFTHAHGDHVAAAGDFLNGYTKQIELQSVIYNFPSYQVLANGYDGNTFTLKDTLNSRYSDVLYHKLHTGEVLNFPGISLEAIYTHEDAVNAEGFSEIKDFNASSSVVRFNVDGKGFMMLGDISSVAEDAIMAMHSKDYLKSDAIQVAHHGYNNLVKLYPAIGAKIALFSNAMDVSKGYVYYVVMRTAKDAYFAHKWTYGFTVEDGVIKTEQIKRYDQK